MFFWWGYQVKNYLFVGLSAHSFGGLVGLCVAVASVSFLFEFLRYLQARQRQKELILRSKQLRTICPTESATLLAQGSARPAFTITMMDRAGLAGADLSLWFLLLNMGYLLMLTVMVFNGWLFVAAVLGGGVGYFVFGQKFTKINLQNCQIIRDTWCMQNCGEPERAGNNDGESTPAVEASTSGGCHATTVKVQADCHK